MNVAITKRELRREYSSRRRQLGTAFIGAASEAIRKRLLDSDFYRNASDVVLFAADAVEPSLLELMGEGGGKRFYLPRYAAECDCYVIAAADSSADLVTGKYGISEPPAAAPEAGEEIAGRALYLVPAVAFDASGNRLGRGKGFYDRLLANAAGMVVGVCFDCQQAAALAAETHDRRLDAVVTESRTIFFTQRSPQ